MLVPPAEQHVGSLADGGRIRQLGLALREPAVEHVTGHLGVELDRPGALSQPVGLLRGVASGEQLGVGGKLEGVVVPLEGVDPAGEHADDRVLQPGIIEDDLVPSHLGIGGAADARARGAGDQLRAEADPEERNLTIERSADERGLVREPGMLGVLVRVHRAAEDHDRVVALRRVGLRTAVDRDPALQHVAALPDEVLEQAPAAGRRGLVDDREDAHATSVAGCAVQNSVGGRSMPRSPQTRLVEQAIERRACGKPCGTPRGSWPVPQAGRRAGPAVLNAPVEAVELRIRQQGWARAVAGRGRGMAGRAGW